MKLGGKYFNFFLTSGGFTKKLTALSFILIFFNFNVNAFEETGYASWYGPGFHGKLTANGEIFDTYALTAAHKTLPLGSIVKVKSLENNREITVRINDRGPFAKNRIIDLSQAAASALDFIKQGTAKVQITLIKEGDNKYHHRKNESVKYTIQAGSFSNKDSAIKLVNSIKKHGLNPEITEVKVNGRILYRVEIKNLNDAMLNSHKIVLNNANINDYIVRTVK